MGNWICGELQTMFITKIFTGFYHLLGDHLARGTADNCHHCNLTLQGRHCSTSFLFFFLSILQITEYCKNRTEIPIIWPPVLYWEYFWGTKIPSHIGKLESVDPDDESEEDSGKLKSLMKSLLSLTRSNTLVLSIRQVKTSFLFLIYCWEDIA